MFPFVLQLKIRSLDVHMLASRYRCVKELDFSFCPVSTGTQPTLPPLKGSPGCHLRSHDCLPRPPEGASPLGVSVPVSRRARLAPCVYLSGH
jgi:hypothetical protein